MRYSVSLLKFSVWICRH